MRNLFLIKININRAGIFPLKFSHCSFQLLCTLYICIQLTIALLTALGMQSIDLSRNRVHFVNCLESRANPGSKFVVANTLAKL